MTRRRTILKIVHWSMVPLVIWFILVTPADVTPFGPEAFRFHSTLALIFVLICLGWTADYLWRGLASRPGPKLPAWGKRAHGLIHKGIIWGLFGVALTGFLLGLTANRLLVAGDILPIAPPLDMPTANKIIGQIHIYEFYALGLLIGVHAAFHIWRHYRLRDNALRIMVPKRFHKHL